MGPALLSLAALLLSATAAASPPDDPAPPARGWPAPTATNRPGLYWWIPGSAMDEENLTWNLETLRDAGFGGVGMVLIYGVKGEEERALDFLSPRWVEGFDFAAREAKRLGLWLDLTPGGGWRLGGPEIEVEESEQRITVVDGRLVPVAVDSRVKRAGPGATGRAFNPYSTATLIDYLAKFDRIYARENSPVSRAFYHDSFEYRGNWCPGFLDAFVERRGYDLLDHAAALGGEGDEQLGAHVEPEPMVSRGLGFVRRRHEGATHYFIANQGAQPVDDWIPLARPAASALVLDPLTGRQGLATLRNPGEVPELHLQLRPGESLILQAFAAQRVEAPAWPIVTPSGEPRELGDEEARRFAGTARYRLELELPAGSASAWRLELGDVRESARVCVNGEPVGTVIAHPFAIDLRGVLRAGRNRIEIEVTNPSANRIRDFDRRGVEWKIFHDINFVDQNHCPFDAGGWAVAPSGLLGPVTLTPLREGTATR